jgi:succinate dehydrogenase / fumarate reductase flavoprotein subunit
LVFGRRAGAGAAAYVKALAAKPTITDGEITRAKKRLNSPFEGQGGENPYSLHQELQQVTQDLVGIIRTESELKDAIGKLASIRERAVKVRAEGGRTFNPGFHLALDLENMLLVSESIALSALQRKESRGGHTRDDYPKMDPQWRQYNHLTKWNGSAIEVKSEEAIAMPNELMELFEMDELKKYFTEKELAKGGK